MNAPSPDSKPLPAASANRLEWARLIVTFVLGVLAALGAFRDKIFPSPSTLVAKSIGYTPTNDVKTELEVFLALNGTRSQIAAMVAASLSNHPTLKTARASHPSASPLVAELEQAVREELDFVAAKMRGLTIEKASSVFSLAELHQLNSFLSTDIARGYVAKQPELIGSLFEKLPAVVEESNERLERRIDQVFRKHSVKQ